MIALYEITEENVNIWEGLFTINDTLEVWFSHTADDEIIIEDVQVIGTGDKAHVVTREAINSIEDACRKWAVNFYNYDMNSIDNSKTISNALKRIEEPGKERDYEHAERVHYLQSLKAVESQRDQLLISLKKEHVRFIEEITDWDYHDQSTCITCALIREIERGQ